MARSIRTAPHAPDHDDLGGAPAPGKRALTDRFAVRRHATAPPVDDAPRAAATLPGTGGPDDPFALHRPREGGLLDRMETPPALMNAHAARTLLLRESYEVETL